MAIESKVFPSYQLTRFYFQRALAAIYLLGFLIAFNQFQGLCGEHGLEPVSLFLKTTSFWQAPSLFWLSSSDQFALALSLCGIGLSLFALTGFSEAFGTLISMGTWLALWLLYCSFVNVGQTFYGFGWEILLLETGFLAIFMGPASSRSSLLLNLLMRWLLFRLMFGAGLIKIRGDECWRDFTCMKYHYETMPLPSPTSWYFHYLPLWVHKLSVLFNHFVELTLPFFYFEKRPLRQWAGLFTIVFQLIIILSGNFSWLNYLTLVIAVSCFDDNFFVWRLPRLAGWYKFMSRGTSKGLPAMGIYILSALLIYLSIRPTLNLLSSQQTMNSSFDALHLVNTYGAFGSITKVRNEVILEGANDMAGPWKEYEFKGKPGEVSRRPSWVSPYHYKIDWQMWFAAMSSYNYHPWIINLCAKLLTGNQQVLNLMGSNPFPDRPPKFIRASLYEYHFSEPGSSSWWRREFRSAYLSPLSMDDPIFRQLLKSQGWLD